LREVDRFDKQLAGNYNSENSKCSVSSNSAFIYEFTRLKFKGYLHGHDSLLQPQSESYHVQYQKVNTDFKEYYFSLSSS